MQKLLAQAGLNPEISSDPQEMISQLSEKDPTLAILAQYLANSKEEQNTIDSEVSDQAEKEQERSLRMLHAVKRLHHLTKDMYEELEQLRKRNDLLAEALGACYLCWGEDPQCEVCSGIGSTGAFEPDLKKFGNLVGPVLKRIQNNSGLSQENLKRKNVSLE